MSAPVGPNGPAQAPPVWRTPVIVEIEGEERDAILREEWAEQAAANKEAVIAAVEDGDVCCALLEVFLDARLVAAEGGDDCCIYAELEAAPEGNGDEHYLYDHAAFKARLAGEPASGGYPPGFAAWPLERRNKWFGANTAAILADSDHLVGRRHEENDLGNGQSRQDAREPLKPKFPLIAWKDIAFDAEEEWVVEEVFPRIGLACLYGGPGSVKTFILIDLFLRIARGGLWGGRNVMQGPVVYIAAEGANGIKKRVVGMKKVLAEKGLIGDVPFYLITVAPNFGAGEDDRKELISCIEALGIRPVAIAVDTTAQSIGGADENGAGMAQLVVNATALVNYFGCLVTLVHHVPLSDDERLRGGTCLIGALDVSILSKRTKGSFIATLAVKKMKDGDDDQTFTVHLVRIVLGRTKKGREISTLVVESVEPGAAEAGKGDGRKLPGSAANAQSALRYALEEFGAIPPASNHIPRGTKCVSLKQWRECAYLRSDLELEDSKKKELSRGISILRAKKLVGIWEAYAWET